MSLSLDLCVCAARCFGQGVDGRAMASRGAAFAIAHVIGVIRETFSVRSEVVFVRVTRV